MKKPSIHVFEHDLQRNQSKQSRQLISIVQKNRTFQKLMNACCCPGKKVGRKKLTIRTRQKNDLSPISPRISYFELTLNTWLEKELLHTKKLKTLLLRTRQENLGSQNIGSHRSWTCCSVYLQTNYIPSMDAENFLGGKTQSGVTDGQKRNHFEMSLCEKVWSTRLKI